MGETRDRFEEGPDLPVDVVDDILAERRRRILLSCLGDHGELSVTDLATEVCAREQQTSPDAVSSDDREDVYVDIYERHLPKLTATGIVDFDSLHDSVELVRQDLLRDGELT